MNKNQKEIAKKILTASPDVEAVYMNPNGEFFTKEYLAKNSLPNGKGKVTTIARKATEDNDFAKTQKEADAKAQKEADAKAQKEADAKAQKEADAKAQKEADAKAQKEADAKAENKTKK